MADELENTSVEISVPRGRTLTQQEWAPGFVAFLSSLGIGSRIIEGGSGVIYPDEPEGDESEFIVGLARLFDARFPVER